MKKSPYDPSKHKLFEPSPITESGVYESAVIREQDKTILKLRMDNAILKMELDNYEDKAQQVCEYGPYKNLLGEGGRFPQCEPSILVIQNGRLPYTYCPHCGRQIFYSGQQVETDDYDDYPF